MTDPLMDAANYISGLPIGLAPIQAGAVFPEPEPEPNSDLIAAIVAAGLQQAARDQAISALVSSMAASGAADDGGEPGLLQFATEMQGQGAAEGDDAEFAALLAAIAAGGASQAGAGPAVGPDIPGMILEQGVKQAGKVAARELGVNDAINQGLDYVKNGITDLAGSVLGGGAGAGLTAAEIGTLLGASELSAAGGLLPALTLSGGGAGGAVAATSPAWGAFSAVPALGFAALAGLIGSDILAGGTPSKPEEHMTMTYNPQTGQMEWSASAWGPGGSQERANKNLEAWKSQWSGENAPSFDFYKDQTDPLQITLWNDLISGRYFPEVQGGPVTFSQGTDTRNQPVGVEGRQYMGGINPAGQLEEYNSRASYRSPQLALEAIMRWLENPNETDYSYLIESQARQDGYADGGVMISGPGDGRADRVPILASDGEFIVPASDLSALGDGSSDAGARKLSRALEAVRMKHAAKLQRQKPPRL